MDNRRATKHVRNDSQVKTNRVLEAEGTGIKVQVRRIGDHKMTGKKGFQVVLYFVGDAYGLSIWDRSDIVKHVATHDFATPKEALAFLCGLRVAIGLKNLLHEEGFWRDYRSMLRKLRREEEKEAERRKGYSRRRHGKARQRVYEATLNGEQRKVTIPDREE